ncbi:MAG: EamA family transporter [Rhizobiales bacterium]|nr:EamA family transporter [Hyphomicrobiales bacterium]
MPADVSLKSAPVLIAADAGGDRPALAAGLVMAAAFGLAFQDGLVKLISGDVSLWQFQSIRAFVNLVLLYFVGGVIWYGMPVMPRRLWAVALRSFLLVTTMVLYFGAVPFLPLATLAACLYTFPLFVAILSAVLLGERVGPRRVLAIIVGFTGTLLIIKPGTDSFTVFALLPLASAFIYAVTIIVTRQLCREESPVALGYGSAAMNLIVGVAGLAALTWFSAGELSISWPYLFTGWHHLSLPVLALVFACGLTNVVANIMLSKAYQSAESSWLAPFDYTYLIFTAFWGFVFWYTLPDLASIVGIALIGGSGTFVAWRERIEKDLPRANFNRLLR